MSQDRPNSSPFQRMARLTGLAGRVGASVLASRLKQLGRAEDERDKERRANLIKNATRIVETLGQMKGAAMKVGQMLSLHEGLLPPEVNEILRDLQNQAPRVSFEVLQAELQRELPDHGKMLATLEPEGFAAASIGQVHRGRLRDGRRVAVKIQYPDIARIVTSDLTNLRRLLRSVFGLVSEMEFEPIWEEIRDGLLEELDYEQEAGHATAIAALYPRSSGIVIPAVVSELTTQHVLTLELEEGISPDEATSSDHSQELRDIWGRNLFEFVCSGLFDHLLLHADPNLANFAFREDGSIVVYDFGCVRTIRPALSQGYARLLLSGADREFSLIPDLLAEMAVMDEAGGPVGRDMTDPYVEMFSEIFRESPAYRFGEREDLYERLIEAGMNTWSQQLDLRFPRDVVFVQRTLSGHFGNLVRLGSKAPWREIAMRYAKPRSAAD